jgi:glycosyltransferase involved in cell wall biosynthesis
MLVRYRPACRKISRRRRDGQAVRILVTVNCRWWNASAAGGVAQALALAGRGHQVLLQAGSGSEVGRRASEAGLETVLMDLEGTGSLTGIVPFRRMVAGFGPDVICCHRAEGQTAAALSTGNVPLVRVRCDIRPASGGFLWRRIDRRTGLVVFPGSFMIERGFAGRRDGPVAVIPQPVDTDRFTPVERGENPRVLLSLARLSPVKGHRTLLRALTLLPDEITAAIAGAPAQQPPGELLGYAEELGVAGRIVLHGVVDDVRTLFPGVLAGVVTSLGSEVVSRAGMEFMASSLPLLAASTNGLPGLVRDGVTGLLHPPGNHEELARQALFLHRNPAVSTRLAGNALRYCRENLSYEAVGRLWEEHLEALAAGEQHPGWRVSRKTGSSRTD